MCIMIANVHAELHVRNAVLVSLVFVVVPFLPSCGLFLDVGFTVAERILFMPRYACACHVGCVMCDCDVH